MLLGFICQPLLANAAMVAASPPHSSDLVFPLFVRQVSSGEEGSVVYFEYVLLFCGNSQVLKWSRRQVVKKSIGRLVN
jgi:hypothetical protein